MKKLIFNDKLYLFRLADGKIYFTDIMSGKSEVIFDDAYGDFDVSCSKEGIFYVICQNTKSFFFLLKYEHHSWSQSCILESSSKEVYAKSFNIVSSGQLQSAFYILKKQNGYALIHHIPFGNSTPEIVTEFPAFAPYFVLTSPSGDIYCIYQQGGHIGYKAYKWNEKSWSAFSVLEEEQESIEFISAVYDGDTDKIHIAYSSQKGGRHKVTYVGATAHEIISNSYTPLLPAVIVNDGIYIMFNFAGRLLEAHSKDNGISFSRPKYFFDGTFSKKEIISIKLRDYGAPSDLSSCLCYCSELPDNTLSVCMLDEKIKALKKPKTEFFREEQAEIEVFAGVTQPKRNPEIERLFDEINKLKEKSGSGFDYSVVSLLTQRLDSAERRISMLEERLNGHE